MTSTSPTTHTGGPPPGSTRESPGTSTRDDAAEEASRLRDEGQDRAQDLAEDAKEHVRGIADVAVSQARDRADEQVQRAGSGLRQASDQMQALASGRPDDAGPLGDYVESVASMMDDWADRLERGGLQGLLGDVSDFARRKPGQFLAGAFAAGVLAGRVGRNVRAADVEMPSSSDHDGPATDSSGATASQASGGEATTSQIAGEDASSTDDEDGPASSPPTMRVTSEERRPDDDTPERARATGADDDRTEVIDVQPPASSPGRQGDQA